MKSPFGRRHPAGSPAPPPAVPPLELALRRRFLVSEGRRGVEEAWRGCCRAQGWPCVIVGRDRRGEVCITLDMRACGWELTPGARARFLARTGGHLVSWYGARVYSPAGAVAASDEVVAWLCWDISMLCRPIDMIPDD